MNRDLHHAFRIDAADSDEEYLFIDVDGFTVAIKRQPDGIVCDIYPLHVLDEAIASTWAHIHDLPAADEEPTP